VPQWGREIARGKKNSFATAAFLFPERGKEGNKQFFEKKSPTALEK